METTESDTTQPTRQETLFVGGWMNISDHDAKEALARGRVTAVKPADKFTPTYVTLSINKRTGLEHIQLYSRMAPDTARNLAQQLIAAANACDMLEDREAREQAQADDVEGAPV